jgi:Mg/Co/Ni transporter MgtE
MLMSKMAEDRLKDVLDAIRALPADARDELVTELEQRVSELAVPHMREEQRAEVKRRLALPRQHVPDEKVRAILRRYNRAL